MTSDSSYPEEGSIMQRIHGSRGLRTWQRATMLGGMAVVGLSLAGLAVGAAASPKMEVLPSPIGVKYGGTVEVKAQNLPKGSGTIALTICGLNNAAGQKIASPTADDCAGANDLNSGLVKLQTWKDGTFDQHYVLPRSGQKFGKNQRFCDSKHYCALVVADANPSAPAYHVQTELQFTDQKPISGSTPTTKPKTTTTKPRLDHDATADHDHHDDAARCLDQRGPRRECGPERRVGKRLDRRDGAGKLTAADQRPDRDRSAGHRSRRSLDDIAESGAAGGGPGRDPGVRGARGGGAAVGRRRERCSRRRARRSSTAAVAPSWRRCSSRRASDVSSCRVRHRTTRSSPLRARSSRPVLQPYSSQLGDVLSPVLGLLP